MQWAISKSVDEIGERGEKLRIKSLGGYGDKTVIDGRQENNKAMLEAMFRRERRKRGRGKGEEEGESRRGEDGDDA